MSVAQDLAPASEEELADIVADHHDRRAPLRIVGGGTRVQNPAPGAPLSLSRLSGVVTYSPGEMTLIARAGTPLPEIQAMLAAEGQALAFEPPDLRAITGVNGVPSIGGMVAANASGPRRLMAGACRDHLLGVRFVDGRGRILKNGGRVMKNVTGLDLSKLLAGSHGTLGILTEVVLKTLPLPQVSATLALSGLDEARALRLFTAALATPFEVSGAAFHAGTAWLRIDGLEAQLAYRRYRLLTLLADHGAIEVLDAGATAVLWRNLRDLAHVAGGDGPLWRILTRPTEAPAIAAALQGLGGAIALDWAGGLIWYAGPGDPAQIRALAPHATLIRRAGLTGPAFAPQTGPLGRIAAGLRQSLDPASILNPGLMDG